MLRWVSSFNTYIEQLNKCAKLSPVGTHLVDLSEGAISQLALEVPHLLRVDADLHIVQHAPLLRGTFTAAREEILQVLEKRHLRASLYHCLWKGTQWMCLQLYRSRYKPVTKAVLVFNATANKSPNDHNVRQKTRHGYLTGPPGHYRLHLSQITPVISLPRLHTTAMYRAWALGRSATVQSLSRVGHVLCNFRNDPGLSGVCVPAV